MRKALTVLLSVLLLSSLISCNGGNPNPPNDNRTQLEKVDDAVSSVSHVFNGIIADKDDKGNDVYEVKEAVEINGMTVNSGTMKVSQDGRNTSVEMDISYNENDQEINIRSRETTELSVKTTEGEEADISLEETNNMLEKAKQIPASSFTETAGENGVVAYTYEVAEPKTAAKRLSLEDTADASEIKKIVITFKYESADEINSASYTYAVTFISKGSEYTATETSSKEIEMKRDNKPVDISEDLYSAFTLDSVQTTEEKETVRLAFSEVHAEGYPTTMADQYFATLVEERTGGAVKIDVYAGGILIGEETQAIDAMKAGELAFARTSSSPLTSFVSEFDVFSLPYLFSFRDHMWKVLDGEHGQQLLQKLDENGTGLYGLAYYDAGARSFYTDTPIDSIDDFTGLKIRVMNSDLMKAMVEALGADAVQDIGPNEVYYAIKEGRIDGAENNWTTYESMGDYEAAPYYFDDGHMRVPEVVLASEKVLDSLDPEYVAIIRQCAKEAQEYEKERWVEREKASKDKIKDSVTITEPDEEMMKALREKMKPVYEEYGADFSDLIDEIQALDS